MENRHYSDELQDLLSERLTGEERLTVENHLRDCAQCRKEMEALRWSQQILSNAASSEPPTDLERSIKRLLDREDRARRWKTFLAYAAVFVLFILGAFYLLKPSDMADKVARDFKDFQAGRITLELRTHDERKMEEFFSANGIDFGTRVFDLGMMQFDVVGGRIHRMRNRKSALWVYRGAEDGVLICQMYRGTESELPKDATLREHNGIRFYVYDREGVTAVFWREGEIFCVLVSDMKQGEVIDLAFAKAIIPA